MEIFEGRYSWDGKKRDDREPIAWFPGSYDLKIINLENKHNNIKHIRPYLCIFTNTGSGYSVSANPENFAKHICEDFSLDIERVLWVERLEIGSDSFEVINFSAKGQLGEHFFYSIERRPPMKNELSIILKEIEP